VQGLAYGLAAGAIWGTVFLAPRVLQGFSPLQVSAGRYLAYGLVSLVLLPGAWKELRPKIRRDDVVTLLWLSAIGNLFYFVLVTAAVQLAGVAPASLTVGLLPVTITLAGSRDHGALALRRLALPLLLVLVGMVAINVDLFLYAKNDGHAWSGKLIGIVCAFGALAAWTIYAAWNARYFSKHHRFTGHEWSLLTGVATGALAMLLSVPAFFFGHAAVQYHAPHAWAWFWFVCFFLAIGPSVIANAFWNSASRLLPLTLSGQLIAFETLFALLYGFVYELRWPRLLELAAILLLVSGITWSAQRHMEPEH